MSNFPRVDPKVKAKMLERIKALGLDDSEAERVYRARLLNAEPLKGEPLTVKAMASNPKAAEVFIYGDIGIDPFTGEGNSADQLIQHLEMLSEMDEINFYVNSDGGDVWEADAMLAITNRLRARKIMHVDGIAASAASYLIQGGDERRIAEHGILMIHDASTGVYGNSRELVAMADVLEKIDGLIASVYARRSGKKADTFRKLMDTDSYFPAQDAIDAGLVDKMVIGKRVAAKLDPSRHPKLPEWVNAQAPAKEETPALPTLRMRIADYERWLLKSRQEHNHPLAK